MISGNRDCDNLNRRSVLKGIGAGASILGTMGTASTEGRGATEKRQLKQQAADAFATDRAVQQALKLHGKPVWKTLESAGSTIDLTLGEFNEVRTFPDERDGVPTAHIVSERDEGTREIEFHILPQVGEAFAVEKTDTGLRRFEAEAVKPAEFCQEDTYCNGYCQCEATGEDCYNCDAGWKEMERCCTYSDGSTSCEIINNNCVSECAPSC